MNTGFHTAEAILILTCPLFEVRRAGEECEPTDNAKLLLAAIGKPAYWESVGGADKLIEKCKAEWRSICKRPGGGWEDLYGNDSIQQKAVDAVLELVAELAHHDGGELGSEELDRFADARDVLRSIVAAL